MEQNLENTQTIPAPSPVIPEPVATASTVVAPVSEPAESHAEKANRNNTQAFLRVREKNRVLKEQLELAKANATPPPAAAPVVVEQAQPVNIEKPTAPAPQAVSSIEVEGKKAIEDLAADKDVASVPGAIIDILDTLDNDTRLTRLYQIDPVIALREARSIWAAKAGISPKPTMPISSSPSGGMSGENHNLQALYQEIEKYHPGSKEYSILVTKINACLK